MSGPAVTAATVQAMLEAAASEIGYHESPAGSNRTKFAAEAGHVNGQPWCATFVVALAKRIGLSLPSTSAYTPTLAAGFQKAGRWSSTPAPGALVFFDFPDNVHRIQHVGIVVRIVDANRIETIEGNTSSGVTGSQDDGGCVARRIRSTSSVVGYGLPEYAPTPNPAPAPKPLIIPAKECDVKFLSATDPETGDVWLCRIEDGAIYTPNGIAPYLGALNEHPEYHAGADESDGKNTVEGFAAKKYENGRWGYQFLVRFPDDSIRTYDQRRAA